MINSALDFIGAFISGIFGDLAGYVIGFLLLLAVLVALYPIWLVGKTGHRLFGGWHGSWPIGERAGTVLGVLLIGASVTIAYVVVGAIAAAVALAVVTVVIAVGWLGLEVEIGD